MRPAKFSEMRSFQAPFEPHLHDIWQLRRDTYLQGAEPVPEAAARHANESSEEVSALTRLVARVGRDMLLWSVGKAPF